MIIRAYRPYLFLLLTLLALWVIYLWFRILFKANQSEELASLFSFIFAGFVMLTITAIFFRGANMALIWPF